jgi:membrane associated rhomboid family serine protease
MRSKQAQSTLGRGSAHAIPWMTFALLCVCAVAFTATQISASATQAAAEVELEAAIEYLNGHVHLDPGPILSERIDPSVIEQKRSVQHSARIRRGTPPIPKAVQLRQQQHLDGLITAAFAGASELPAQRWGFRATAFDPLTLLSHIVFHTSAMHLTGSLFLLLMLGFQLESAWGSGTFLAVVSLSGVVSAAVYGVANSGFDPPLVGLSGTLAALLVAFAIRCRSLWDQPVYSFLLICGGVFLVVPVRWGSEWSIAGGLAQAQLLVEHRGASLWSLVGGFGFGLLAERAIAWFAAAAAGPDGPSERRAKFVASPEFQKAVNARAAGKLNEARSILVGIARGAEVDREALILLWDVALELGNPAEASDAMLRAIRTDIKFNDLDAAVEHWLDLDNRGLSADAEPALLIRVAVALEQREQRFAAVAALKQALSKADSGNAAVIAARVAKASRELDPDTARDAAWRALGAMDLDFEERQSLEAMLGEIGPGIDLGVLRVAPDRGLDVDLDSEPLAVGGDAPEAAPEVWVDSGLTDEVEVVELEHVVHREETPRQGAPGSAAPRPEAIEIDFVNRTARSVAATPIALDSQGLLVEVASGSKKRVPLDRIEALAVAAVGGLGPKAVVVIDVVMNWESAGGDPLKILRMRGDRFDPSALVPGTADRLEALRAFTRELLYKSATIGLPDPQSVAGMPFAAYDDLDSYERAVLGISGD